jgi:hypothetical protein
MIDVEKFKIKRHDLKDIVQQLNPTSYNHELKTYDFIINVCEKNNSRVNSDLEEIFGDIKLIKDVSELPELLESVKKDSLRWKTEHKHDPAFFIVHNFGVEKEYNYKRHLSRFVDDNNIRGKYYLNPQIIAKIENLAYEDGAMLIDENQNIVYTHAHIINLNPPALIEKYYPETLRKNYNPNNPKYFGFRQELNTRHLSALYASFHFPNSIIYTLGERLDVRDEIGKLLSIDDGHIRRYEDGLITFSTYDREIDTVKRSVNILKNK